MEMFFNGRKVTGQTQGKCIQRKDLPRERERNDKSNL